MAVASLRRPSPSRMLTSLDGARSGRITADAATGSGGETIAARMKAETSATLFTGLNMTSWWVGRWVGGSVVGWWEVALNEKLNASVRLPVDPSSSLPSHHRPTDPPTHL